jgi:hypothetical protein
VRNENVVSTMQHCSPGILPPTASEQNMVSLSGSSCKMAQSKPGVATR